MDQQKDTLVNLRGKLLQAFKLAASRDCISVYPNQDILILDLCDRLYDETVGDRRINFDFDSDTVLPLNGFEKSIGFEPNEFHLLTVIVSKQSMDIGRLWAIYRGWLHDGISSEAVLETGAI